MCPGGPSKKTHPEVQTAMKTMEGSYNHHDFYLRMVLQIGSLPFFSWWLKPGAMFVPLFGFSSTPTEHGPRPGALAPQRAPAWRGTNGAGHRRRGRQAVFRNLPREVSWPPAMASNGLRPQRTQISGICFWTLASSIEVHQLTRCKSGSPENAWFSAVVHQLPRRICLKWWSTNQIRGAGGLKWWFGI